MDTANFVPNKFQIVAVFLLVGIVGTARSETLDRAEIERGFRNSVRCIRGGQIPSQWCGTFHKLIREFTSHSTSSFLLGANFGFSFTSETAAETIGADSDELLRVAKCALTARVDYERIKRELHLTDADVSKILRVSPKKFAAWKSRASSKDDDNSIAVETHGITL